MKRWWKLAKPPPPLARQHLRVAELLLADGASELEALRPFHLDWRNCQKQRARKIALAADARLSERFLGGNIGEPFGEAGRGGRIDGDEIGRFPPSLSSGRRSENG